MLKTGKKVQGFRRFSEDFKLKIVSEYEKGEMSVSQLKKYYEISYKSIYAWIYKYSKYNKKSIQVVEIKDSQMNKIKLLEQRIKELEV